MKKYFTKFSLLIILLITILSSKSSGQERYKKIQRNYKVNSGTTLNLSSKYGTLHIVDWNKDSVSIKVEILKKGELSGKTKKLIENIHFDFKSNAFFINVKTLFGNKKSGFIRDFRDFISETNLVSINYMIKIPSYLNLNIEHKYGNIFIDEFKGILDLRLTNGKIKANKLGANNKIKLKFSKAEINRVVNAEIEGAFDTNIKVKKAQQLTLNTNSTNIELDFVNVLKINSRNDVCKIKTVNYFYGNSHLSNIKTNLVNKEVSLDIIYGNVNLLLANNFNFVNLDNKFSELKLTFAKGYGYKLKIIHKDTKIFFDKQVSLKQNKVKRESTVTYGNIGATSAKSKIDIISEDCKINFCHQ